jgi:tRNA(Ile)-lysidine synthase
MTMDASPGELAARHAVAESLGDVQKVVVACSGGPDSVALAAVTAWVGERQGVSVGAVIVDHQLQPGSAQMAQSAADACSAFGLSPVVIRQVTITGAGGLEAAARSARYAALHEVAQEMNADAILLGHTRDDQAETVLLRLLRGSGARSLAAMRPVVGVLRRPFLVLPRSVVHSVAQELAVRHGVQLVHDPHNEDPAFARVRVRQLLTGWPDRDAAIIGLARSAALLADDADYLDALADEYLASIDGDPSIDALMALPRAIRTRILRTIIRNAGSPAGSLTYDHVMSVEALISRWHGQGEVALPGRVRAWRECGRLRVQAANDERE